VLTLIDLSCRQSSRDGDLRGDEISSQDGYRLAIGSSLLYGTHRLFSHERKLGGLDRRDLRDSFFEGMQGERDHIPRQLMFLIAIHLTSCGRVVLLALIDYLAARPASPADTQL